MEEKAGKRAAARTFEDLVVWQKAHQFALAVYRLTRAFPRSEVYGLTSQFRRAAVSIAANIAEGFRKRGNADKGRFLNIAQGSLEESRYYLIFNSRFGVWRRFRSEGHFGGNQQVAGGLFSHHSEF